jgi:hypothetical protein
VCNHTSDHQASCYDQRRVRHHHAKEVGKKAKESQQDYHDAQISHHFIHFYLFYVFTFSFSFVDAKNEKFFRF